VSYTGAAARAASGARSLLAGQVRNPVEQTLANDTCPEVLLDSPTYRLSGELGEELITGYGGHVDVLEVGPRLPPACGWRREGGEGPARGPPALPSGAGLVEAAGIPAIAD
jgi:hypothetical protein